ncbi:MAG: hypothetical protein OEM49_01790 [Myxococcales bacterium]|nr:hypothetical protein [Myxococcales bacterium]MDH5307301.1 hypothetical protein [Myxococcales bacterium]MDH5566271.1 hypothetical protein [Myxococcales bacterium]
MTGRTLTLLCAALLLLAASLPGRAEVAASFRYPLANFSGPVPSHWAKLAVDPERNEVYALDERHNDIRVFDEHGMEIFVFGDAYASAADIAVGQDGSIFLLTSGYQTTAVHLLNYRGEYLAELELKNVPAAYKQFLADQLLYQNGSLYLVDSNAMRVLELDEAGYFRRGYDLKAALRPSLALDDAGPDQLQNIDRQKKKLQNADLGGLAVDANRNLFFTVPTLFVAYRLSADGTLTQFGRSGSGTGKFGVAAGIATDAMGYVYVTDRLRSVVLVFSSELEFQTEFGYRGDQPSNLIVPDDLVIDTSGNVYVGQAANRGVSVFGITYETSRSSQSSDPASGITTPSPVSQETEQTVEEKRVSARLEFIADEDSNHLEDLENEDQ